jgi:LuxR family maltose regulon positive regulatory protein
LSAQILATKLHIPPFRPDLISRPAILEDLEKGLSCKLTLVSAPAGFGKSTILSEWAAKSQRPITWFSLDEGDNDPQRFFVHFIAALGNVKADLAETYLDLLQSPQLPPVESFLTGLINEIASISTLFILVLDDYHVVTNRTIHDGLIFLVDNIPPQLHLVISGRADPPWPTARLRAQGMLNEIRTNDLRFTSKEVAEFLLDVMALDLSSQDISALENRTEGWIAGLQMAALSLKGRRDVTSFLKSFTGSHRFIMDYLVEEILEGQSSVIQKFLLKTSILDRMTAGLCKAVVGDLKLDELEIGEEKQEMSNLKSTISIQQILEFLEHTNLFVIPLDDERNWYRYHHLFSQLLQSRLKQVDPVGIADLHLRASYWYEAEDISDQAIAHAFAAGDTQRAADLVEQHAMNMITRSELGSLSKWLSQLPDEILRSRPWLSTYQAWIKYWHGPRGEVEGWLEAAENALEDPLMAEKDLDGYGISHSLSEGEKNHILGQIAAIRAYGAIPEGNYKLVAQMGEKGLSLLPQGDFAQSVCAVALGVANWGNGNIEGSLNAFEKAKEFALLRGNRQQAITAYCYYGEQQIKQSHLHEALRTFEEGLKVAERKQGQLIGSAGFPLIEMADVYREWNELDKAEVLLSQGIELGLPWGIADFVANIYVIQLRIQLAREDLTGAWSTLQKADDLESRMKVDPWIHARLDENRLRFWLASGDLVAGKEWLEKSGIKADGELSYIYELHHLNLAWLLINLGKEEGKDSYFEEAIHLLKRILRAAEDANWIHEAIKTLILQSIAMSALGNHPGAQQALIRALKLAQPGGYVRIFIDEGPPIVRLLGQLQEQAEVGEYAEHLLAASESQQEMVEQREMVPLSIPQKTSVAPTGGLSEREMEVLRLLKTGMTSKEIADSLFIATSTTRSHLKSIYRKLDVHSRLEAIQRAEDLGLF